MKPISFLDFRPDPHPEWNARTMGQVTEADDSHVWISRQHDGVHISIRYPVTPTAAGVLDDYVQRIQDILVHVLRGGSQPMSSDAVGWTRLCSDQPTATEHRHFLTKATRQADREKSGP